MDAGDTGASLTLLGGVPTGERLERIACARVVDGWLERAVAEVLESTSLSRPERITRMLCATLEHVGGRQVDRELVDGLCVADRQYLVLQVARRLDGDGLWVFPRCTGCGAQFDVYVDRMTLPVSSAGPSFPFAEVELRGRRVRFRVPTGADEHWIAWRPGAVTERHLLGLCLVSVDGEAIADAVGFVASLADEEVAEIDEALDEVSPDVGTRLLASCPECSFQQVVELDVATMSRTTSDAIVEEVHTLAMYYHWSEAEILGLPRERRRRYLGCIARQGGAHA